MLQTLKYSLIRMIITAKVLLTMTLTEHYYHDGLAAKSSEKVALHKI